MDEEDLFENEPVGDEETCPPWLRVRLRLMIWWLKIRLWLAGGWGTRRTHFPPRRPLADSAVTLPMPRGSASARPGLPAGEVTPIRTGFTAVIYIVQEGICRRFPSRRRPSHFCSCPRVMSWRPRWNGSSPSKENRFGISANSLSDFHTFPSASASSPRSARSPIGGSKASPREPMPCSF